MLSQTCPPPIGHNPVLGGGVGAGLLLVDGILEDPWELLGHSACIHVARTRRCAQTT